jgi:hypothetical protein
MIIVIEAGLQNADERVQTLLHEKKIYGAIDICLNFPVSEYVLINVLEICSQEKLIEIWGDREGYRINIKSLSRSTVKVLLKTIYQLAETNGPYRIIVERRRPKAT